MAAGLALLHLVSTTERPRILRARAIEREKIESAMSDCCLPPHLRITMVRWYLKEAPMRWLNSRLLEMEEQAVCNRAKPAAMLGTYKTVCTREVSENKQRTHTENQREGERERERER